jgi:hypothetical protein
MKQPIGGKGSYNTTRGIESKRATHIGGSGDDAELVEEGVIHRTLTSKRHHHVTELVIISKKRGVVCLVSEQSTESQ